MSKHFRKGLDGRMRDKNGEIREKRGDTQVETLRDEYGRGFGGPASGDTTLQQVLIESGEPTLSQCLKHRK